MPVRQQKHQQLAPMPSALAGESAWSGAATVLAAASAWVVLVLAVLLCAKKKKDGDDVGDKVYIYIYI